MSLLAQIYPQYEHVVCSLAITKPIIKCSGTQVCEQYRLKIEAISALDYTGDTKMHGIPSHSRFFRVPIRMIFG